MAAVRDWPRAMSPSSTSASSGESKAAARVLLLCAAVGIAGATADAQALLHDFPGAASGDLYGIALERVGDFDGDAVPDFAIGVMRSETPLVDAGHVEIRSGTTGAILRDWIGPGANAQFGKSVAAAGDLDLDGTPDVFVGMFTWGPSPTFRPGAVRAISGATGATLFEVFGAQHDEWYGGSIAAIGDVDGDGRTELAVGGKRFADFVGQLGSMGRVQVLSGFDGSELYALVGSGHNSDFGQQVSALGDVDGDGSPDFVIGAPGDSVAGDRTGIARVVRGVDGATIHTITGEQTVMLLGEMVAGAGDVDGDGRADFLVGATRGDFDGLNDNGSARLYSGATGLLLRAWNGTVHGDRLGSGLAGGADIDLDGVPDLILGSRRFATPSRARVCSGATGADLFALDGLTAADDFGLVVAWLGDLDGDGRADFGVSAQNDDPGGNNSGRVRVWRACTPPVSYCTGKVNSLGCVPAMTISGSTGLSGADDLVVSGQQVINNSLGMMIWSRAPNATPFGGGTLCLLPPLRRTPIVPAGGTPPGVRDCSGVISFAFTHAYATTQGMRPGDRIYCQCWSRDVQSADGTGLSLSNALEFRWCP